MKKFVLVNSPIYWETTSEEEEYLSPLELGYIATYLKKGWFGCNTVRLCEGKARSSGYFETNFFDKSRVCRD